MMYSIAILLIIGIAIYLIRLRYNNFIKRRKLTDDFDNNIDGMLIELIDKGLSISTSNDSVEGKFSMVIKSNTVFKYSDVSDYILQVRDYLRLFNYNNVNLLYVIRENNSESKHNLWQFGPKIKIDNIPNCKMVYIGITFEIDKNFIDRALFGRTEDTGPR